MPEHLRALVVILFLAATVFGFAQRTSLHIIDRVDYVRWRNLWFSLTLVAFFSHNYWLYAVVALLFIRFYLQRDNDNPLAYFFLLLYIIPAVSIDVPGFGVVNFLFTMTQFRLLELVILLPAYLILRREKETVPFGRMTADKLFIAFQLLIALLLIRESNTVPWSPTNIMRSWFELFIDTFLPYYVASRSLRSLQHFKTALLAFVITIMVMSLIALFEFVKHWQLYSALVPAMGLDWGYRGYLGRAGILRASAASGHAIILGYLTTIALGFYLFLKRYTNTKEDAPYAGATITSHFGKSLVRSSGFLLLLLGLIATLSRGPWVGAAAMFAVFIATGNRAVKRIVLAGLGTLAALPLLSLFPTGQKLVNMLPFIGTIESGTIDYRQQLLEHSLVVIERFPLFGSRNALEEPEMQQMMQGEGIIDLVNSYIEIALYNGLISVGLFIGFFLVVTMGVRRAYLQLPAKDEELRLLGRAIFSVLVAIQLIIFTVSSIITVPIIYWSVAGIGVAYIILAQKHLPRWDRGDDEFDYWDETPSNTYR